MASNAESKLIKVIIVDKGDTKHADVTCNIPASQSANEPLTDVQTQIGDNKNIGQGDFSFTDITVTSEEKQKKSILFPKTTSSQLHQVSQTLPQMTISTALVTGSGTQVVLTPAEPVRQGAPQQDILAEMKRRLSLTFMKEVLTRRKQEKERMSQLVPGRRVLIS